MDKPLTIDEIITLANSLQKLPEHRLMTTWSYVQSIKYNGLKKQYFNKDEYKKIEFIFQSIELPIIKRLFPLEYVNKKVKMHLNFMLKVTRQYSNNKLKQYLEYQKAGLSMEKAREKIKPIHKEWFLNNRIIYYSQPYKLKYDINCRDADILFDIGIDKFVQLFYDKFYQPITYK